MTNRAPMNASRNDDGKPPPLSKENSPGFLPTTKTNRPNPFPLNHSDKKKFSPTNFQKIIHLKESRISTHLYLAREEAC